MQITYKTSIVSYDEIIRGSKGIPLFYIFLLYAYTAQIPISTIKAFRFFFWICVLFFIFVFFLIKMKKKIIYRIVYFSNEYIKSKNLL